MGREVPFRTTPSTSIFLTAVSQISYLYLLYTQDCPENNVLLHDVSWTQMSQLQMLPMEGKRDNFDYRGF